MYIKKQKTKNSGFTLIETLVYISVLVIILVFVVNTVSLITKSYNGLKVSRSINSSATSILERISREIRWSSSIDEGLSVFNTDLGILTLNTLDDDGNIIQAKFFIENGDLKIEKPVGIISPLNIGGAEVQKMILHKIDTGVSDMVKIELELSGEWGDRSKTETFYNSVVLRESYNR